jgi:probable rRNA maturation factor
MPMTIEIDVQRASGFDPLPTDAQFEKWAVAALGPQAESTLTIRLVDEDESRQLNAQYRGKDYATNVLSFPADLPAELDLPLRGDVVICAPLVAREAAEQSKDPEAHWAHLTIHGILHLLGHDHQGEPQAGLMEALEIELLASMGFPDPYR